MDEGLAYIAWFALIALRWSKQLSNMAGRQRQSFSRRITMAGGLGQKSKVQYENTYRMEPHSVFDAEKARKVVREILEAQLDGVSYDPATCMDLAKSLAVEIKERFKEMKVRSIIWKYVGLSAAQAFTLEARTLAQH